MNKSLPLLGYGNHHYTYPVVKEWYVGEDHDHLLYDADLRCLFASTRHGKMVAYQVEEDDSPTHVANVLFHNTPHSSAVTGLLMLPETTPKRLITCSLDASIKIQSIGLSPLLHHTPSPSP